MLCVGRVLSDKNCRGTQSGFPPCGRTYAEAEQRSQERHPLFAAWIPVLQHSLLHLHVCLSKTMSTNSRLSVGRQFLNYYKLQQLEALCDAPVTDTTVSQGSEDPPNNCYSHL